MGYSVKLGKGGHGLEVYDSEGKYANDFSFEMNGQNITGYDDFRTMYFDELIKEQGIPYTSEQLESFYKNNIDFKTQVDGQLYDEYNNMLQYAVDKRNAEQIWDTPEETAQHLDELFEIIKKVNPQDTSIIILPGCSHGNGMYKQTDMYQDRIKEFISKNL